MNVQRYRDHLVVSAAVLGPLAVAAALLPSRGSWPNTNVALILVVAVVAVAAAGNRLAGGLAALSAVAWWDFFFTRPYGRFTINGSADITTAVVLLVVGLAVSQLAARARRLRVIAVTGDSYLTEIHETATAGHLATSPDAVVETVRARLTSLLDLEQCRFERGRLLGHPPRLEADGTITTRFGHRDIELSGLPPEEFELLVYSNGQYYGRFMLKARPGSRPSPRALMVAVTLAQQAGHAAATRSEPASSS